MKNNSLSPTRTLKTAAGVRYATSQASRKVSPTQKLEGLISLCPLCHRVKHLGLADKQGYGEIARQHMKRVNHMSVDQ